MRDRGGQPLTADICKGRIEATPLASFGDNVGKTGLIDSNVLFAEKGDEGGGANGRNGERLQNSKNIYIYNPKRLIGVEQAKKAFLLLPVTVYGRAGTLLRVLGAMTLHL